MESNRSVLEVLGFLAALEILRCTSCVSQHWLRLSNSHEIWRSLCDSANISSADIASCQLSPKLAYKQLRDVEIFNLVIGTNCMLKLFDCRTHETLAQISCAIQTTGSAVMVRDNEAFITGNGKSHKQALLVHFGTAQVTEYPDSLNERKYHASVCLFRTVFLFGGDISDGKSAEKCSLSNKEWSRLPPMPVKRSAFTPCVRKRCIYLCGGNADVCHVFDTRTNVYEELPFRLPGSSWCVATFVGQDLVLENGRYRSKWRPGEEIQTFTSAGRSITP